LVVLGCHGFLAALFMIGLGVIFARRKSWVVGFLDLARLRSRLGVAVGGPLVVGAIVLGWPWSAAGSAPSRLSAAVL